MTGWLLLAAAFAAWLAVCCYALAWITYGHEPLIGPCTCPEEGE